MKFFYNKDFNRLEIYFDNKTNVNGLYWDNVWNENKKIPKNIYKKNTYVSKITKKYIQNNSKILEAGCGLGQFVYSLKKNKYDSYGIDIAKHTVNLVNKKFPDLNIVNGDVEKLPFNDNFFDGIWSLGLIEHFYNSHTKVLSESRRVLKPKGYFFLIFPSISILNKIKIYFNMYDPSDKNIIVDKKAFYQFKLNEHFVIKELEDLQFKLIKKIRLDGIKGIKDEISFLQPIFRYIYNSNNIFFKILSKIINKLFSNFTNHITLLIVQKK